MKQLSIFMANMFLGIIMTTSTGMASECKGVQPQLPPNGKCSRDINQWGYSSRCDCPDTYKYDQSLGSCVYSFYGKSLGCTKDINDWGNPSQCWCDSGYEYNEKVGKCLAN